MKVAFPKWRQLSIRGNEPKLWPFGAALAAGFATAIIGLIGLTWLAWLLLHRPSPPHPGTISLHDAVSVIQLVFASVAGSGALVALIVAYRKQKIAEADSAHDRTRVFNERFTTIATQLGDESPAVRLAAVHAMAGLADDWEANQQTCIDVLCAYLRMPYEPDPGEDASATERRTFQSNREVRHTVIRIITAHLRDDAAVSWQGRDLDFTGAIFDGGDFSGAKFTGGTVAFRFAEFTGDTMDFHSTRFTDGAVDFHRAKFTGGAVDFGQAKFTGGIISFSGTEFTGGTVDFRLVEFTGSAVIFMGSEFTGGTVTFGGAKFTGGTIDFGQARFTGSTVHFSRGKFTGGTIDFTLAKFGSGRVNFGDAKFTDGTIDFSLVEFTGSAVIFMGSEFTGGTVTFGGAKFTGGTVDFSRVSKWSHPPSFDEPVPSQVKLPAEPDPASSEG